MDITVSQCLAACRAGCVWVRVKGHLSICRGVGELNVSDISQVKPLTHMSISSSEVAGKQKTATEWHHGWSVCCPGERSMCCMQHNANARYTAELKYYTCVTCQAERFEPKLGPVENDEAVGLVQPGGRVLHISLKVTWLLPRPDLLNLSNINWRARNTKTSGWTLRSYVCVRWKKNIFQKFTWLKRPWMNSLIWTLWLLQWRTSFTVNNAATCMTSWRIMSKKQPIRAVQNISWWHLMIKWKYAM